MSYFLQIPEGVPDDEAVRIFVEFKKMDSAIKGDLGFRFSKLLNLFSLCICTIKQQAYVIRL